MKNQQKVLVIGCGGIGSHLVDALVRACSAVEVACEITIMDSDIVSSTNLGHQRFSSDDVGCHKVKVIEKAHHQPLSSVSVVGLPSDLNDPIQLAGFDFIAIAVDRPEPRRLVHEQSTPWIDLRCSGDGYMVLTYESNGILVDTMTPNHPPKSCQVEGAIELGNIEFGFLIAAAHGAQWCFQHLRGARGPKECMGSITNGSFHFPEVVQ